MQGLVKIRGGRRAALLSFLIPQILMPGEQGSSLQSRRIISENIVIFFGGGVSGRPQAGRF